jgi:hypothetical protein
MQEQHESQVHEARPPPGTNASRLPGGTISTAYETSVIHSECHPVHTMRTNPNLKRLDEQLSHAGQQADGGGDKQGS